MILYLEYLAQGKRGGEKYHAHLHSFLAHNFDNVVPQKLDEFPQELAHPLKHAKYNLSLVKRHRPDLIVVDISSSFRNLLAIRWTKANKKRVLAVVQEQRLTYRLNNVLARWLVRRCENYLLKHADIVLANSRYSAEIAGRKGHLNHRVVVAPPGLEVEPISLSEAPAGNSKNRKTIELLFVGECSYRKGLKPLVKAMSRLKGLDIHLNVAGRYSRDDPYFQQIQKIIDRNHLDNRITFLGFTERGDLERFYRECSIFVCPSLSEGYGMALAEAVVHGLPIVATTAGAISEMVTNNVNALLVKPGDSRSLATAIAKLAEDDSLRVAMRKANIKKAATLLTWDDFHKTLEAKLAPVIRDLIPR